jgi:hypothetical protein
MRKAAGNLALAKQLKKAQRQQSGAGSSARSGETKRRPLAAGAA